MDENSGADGIYQLPGAIYNRGHNFTGIGFGLFGLERRQLYMVVAAVWLFQIILSIIWLKYFRFGPFECMAELDLLETVAFIKNKNRHYL